MSETDNTGGTPLSDPVRESLWQRLRSRFGGSRDLGLREPGVAADPPARRDSRTEGGPRARVVPAHHRGCVVAAGVKPGNRAAAVIEHPVLAVGRQSPT